MSFNVASKTFLFVALCLATQAPMTRTADAQYDPGMPVSEILQSHSKDIVGWMGGVEVSRTAYTEHWCMLPTFRNFGADRGTTALTQTSFRQLNEVLDTKKFIERCSSNNGVYHVANVNRVF